MIELCKKAMTSKYLMGIHLNDNGITDDFSNIIEISEIFGILSSDIPVDRLIEKDMKVKKPIYEKIGGFDLTYPEDIQKYMCLK